MRRSYRHLMASEVIVNLKSDKAFRGALWAQHRDLLVLKKATLLEHGKETEVDGEIVIERANVDFLQVVSR